MSVKVLQLHKRSSYEYKNIQDKYSFSPDTHCYAIADGTTQSFNSEYWAEAITDMFIRSPSFDCDQLISQLKNCAEKFKAKDFVFSSNPAKASLEKEKLRKGSTATFIGINIQHDQLSIIASGDSNVFILGNNEIVSFPFTNLKDLDNNKYFLNTEKLLSGEVDQSFFQAKQVRIQSSDVVVLMTDALSRFILANKAAWNELVAVRDFDEFKNFCLKYWDNKQMEEDDITAMFIQDFDSRSSTILSPPDDFSFPREEDRKFIFHKQVWDHEEPENKGPEKFNNQFTTDMLDNINEQFNEVKKKMKLHEMLLMVLISVGLLNIFCIYYFRPEKEVVSRTPTEQPSAKALNDSLAKKQKEIESLKKTIKEKNDESKNKPVPDAAAVATSGDSSLAGKPAANSAVGSHRKAQGHQAAAAQAKAKPAHSTNKTSAPKAKASPAAAGSKAD